MVVIDVKYFEALIFDLDGVILSRRAAQTGAAFVPFDLEK
jgi:hypothetical protein